MFPEISEHIRRHCLICFGVTGHDFRCAEDARVMIFCSGGGRGGRGGRGGGRNPEVQNFDLKGVTTQTCHMTTPGDF